MTGRDDTLHFSLIGRRSLANARDDNFPSVIPSLPLSLCHSEPAEGRRGISCVMNGKKRKEISRFARNDRKRECHSEVRGRTHRFAPTSALLLFCSSALNKRKEIPRFARNDTFPSVIPSLRLPSVIPSLPLPPLSFRAC
jgi:hypothetical protein